MSQDVPVSAACRPTMVDFYFESFFFLSGEGGLYEKL